MMQPLTTRMATRIPNWLAQADILWTELKRRCGVPKPHPAVPFLIESLSVAKRTRVLDRIRSPRRFVLTFVAIALGLVWLGQAILGVLFRSPASTDRLHEWLTLSFFIYCGWSFLKLAAQKPVEPFEWTNTEKELLLGAPLKRRDVICFRCSTIARSALIKATIFTFVMIPDLKLLPVGFLAILAGLVLIEFVRLATETVVYGLSKRELMWYRIAVFGFAGIVLGRAILLVLNSPSPNPAESTTVSIRFVVQALQELRMQQTTWYGAVVLAPFQWLADCIAADRVTISLIFKMLFVGSVVVVMSVVITKLDTLFSRRRAKLEWAKFSTLVRTDSNEVERSTSGSVRRPVRLSGIGSLAWRQWRGAMSFRYSLLVAMGIPAGLACMPAYAGIKDLALVANTVGALAFYSMILLPASLRFDFRRDIDRLNVLKSLPISPFSVCAGQLAVPLLLTTIFQLFALVLVMSISPYSPIYIAIAIAVLAPFNLFIFGFENLVFLWYPYRHNQEGLQVLLRSILVFTAKSLLFTLAFAVSFGWVLVSRAIADSLGPLLPSFISPPLVFSLGLFLMASVVSFCTFGLLVRAFEKFDPSADLVGLD